MTATRSAVAPVAQAFATLYTGIPVWPICFCSLLPDPLGRLEVARADNSDLLHCHPAVRQRAGDGLGGQVDQVQVGMLAELRHVDAEDPALRGLRCHVAHPPRGSKPNPIASVPLRRYR